MKTHRATKVRNSADPELASYSVYVGRKRLGRFVRSANQAFDAFGSNDQHLGTFRTDKEAVKAIQARSSWRR